MQEYFVTERVKARPMTWGQYNEHLGVRPALNENPYEDGYLVSYRAGNDLENSTRSERTTWLTKERFEETYRETECLGPEAVNLRRDKMDFGQAIGAMKLGCKVAREGWNGKGMWVALQDGSNIAQNKARGGAAMHRRAELEENREASLIKILPHIDMRAADGSIVVGWLASQTDMLAEDWMIVE